jgi:hypothetical protein
MSPGDPPLWGVNSQLVLVESMPVSYDVQNNPYIPLKRDKPLPDYVG